MKYLENLLYEKTKGTKSEILFTQWSYDKKVVPQALTSISNLFPHYSLHDVSHSVTIINNIIRILGRDAISKLSAIDLWLILESSYYHDIGMVVSSSKLLEAVNSKEFIIFFQNLLVTPTHSLYEFAKDYKIKNNQLIYVKKELSLKQHDGIKFILAEYFRQQHSNRSEKIIINPNEEFELSSPRNAMPKRIFKTLGKISSHHTKSFDDVMKLSFCEVGIDTEDMHPRFIACLLRIGDLLDLDNDRFSNIMLNTLVKIPLDTLTHRAKHISIESFRVDKNQISIYAKCKTYEVAEITQHWFDYINSEITNQMSNWNKIVPFKDIGYLPSIDSLKVELSPYEYIDGKNKPKFSVDTTKALELLKGAGIYEKPEQSFREILQNAVDSTLIRIWEEHKNDIDIFKIPYTEQFKNIIKKYPISVNIKTKKIKSDTKIWTITIEDNAMGLSSTDLKYLMNAGSSSKNQTKKNIIRSMPKWLQPSGVFGIGFQSIFQVTDKVIIQTKDFFDEQYQEITLHSPNSSKDGAILVEKKESNHSIKPSSKIIFQYKTKKIPNSYSIGMNYSYTKKVTDNYDYFSSKSLDVELAYIIDEIVKFSSNSYFLINLNIDSDKLKLNNNILEKPFKYFDEKTSLEFNISPNITAIYQTQTYYKNQFVEKNNLSIKFIGMAVNIHTDSATKVLTLNRNEIKKDYNNILAKNVMSALFRIITKNYDNFNSQEKQYLSMFLHFYFSDKDLQKYNDYKNIKIKINAKDYSIDKLLDYKKIKIIYLNDHSLHHYQDEYLIDKKTLVITINNYINDEITKFLFFKVRDIFKSITIFKKEKEKIVILRKKKQKNPYTDDGYQNIINSLSKSRVFLPCMIDDYNNLRLKQNAYAPWVSAIGLSEIYPVPKMLSPFIVKEQKSTIVLNKKLINWVYNNRYVENTTKEDIESDYKRFIKKFHKGEEDD